MSSPLCFSMPRERETPPWAGLTVLLLAGFVTIFDLFVVNVAIPSIQAGLGANFAEIGLIVAGYELAFGVLLITGGRLGDRFGRRRLFIIGMAGFTLASAFCGPRLIPVILSAPGCYRGWRRHCCSRRCMPPSGLTLRVLTGAKLLACWG